MSDFNDLLEHLQKYPRPLTASTKPHEPDLSNAISAIQVHPALEATLHILNLDLASAHFLVRHMQSPPAYEGMYLHGILHRIEGDFDNARMWYSDVQDSDIYQSIWRDDGKTFKQVREERGAAEEDLDQGQKFLNRVQLFTNSSDKEEIGVLEHEDRRELSMVIDWCISKFGTDRVEDATKAWVKPSDDIKQTGEDQVSGAAGRRTF